MDVTDKIEGQKLKELAQYDALCGIFNRQYAYQLLLEEFYHAIVSKNPLCILMMDIDEFKAVNDCYGHIAGDKVLAHVAGLIQNELRQDDIFCRYGGDEFMIGLLNTALTEARRLANHLCLHIAQQQVNLGEKGITKSTISSGIRELAHESTLDELIDIADKKLYDAKREGRNRVIS